MIKIKDSFILTLSISIIEHNYEHDKLHSPKEPSKLADMAAVPLNVTSWKLISGVSSSAKFTHSQSLSFGERESSYLCTRLLVVPMMKTLWTPLTEQSFISINMNLSLMLVDVQNKIHAMSRNLAPSWCFRLPLPLLISHNSRDGTPKTRIIVRSNEKELYKSAAISTAFLNHIWC